MIAQAFAALLPSFLAAGNEKAPGPTDPYWYGPVGTRSSAGVEVRDETAMGVGAYNACLRILCEGVASLPAIVYRRLPNGGKDRAPQHPLYRLLHGQPNAWQTSFDWRSMGMAHLCNRGIFYNRLVFDRQGDIEQIIPLNPDRMGPAEQRADGRLKYRYQRPGAAPVTLLQEELFIVRGLTLDGITPLSILQFARNAIGLSAAQETHGATFFENGSVPPFWIKWAGTITEERSKNFRRGWRAMHAGATNANNPPILDGGNTLESLPLNNRDSQWIESREFQGLEICRFFRMQAHKAGFMKQATFSNIEEQNIEHVTDTLMPWYVRFEQSAARDLFDDDEYFLEFLVDGKLRGNLATRTEALSKQFLNGELNHDEWREIENRNPLPDGLGKRHYVPLNLVPIEQAGEKFTSASGAVEAAGGGGGQGDAATGRRGDAATALNGAQITAAVDVMVKLREQVLQPGAAVELLSGIGIDRARAQTIVDATPVGLDNAGGDIAFKREILKMLLQMPAAREAVYNGVDVEDLVLQTGLTPEAGYEAPFIPLVAPSGPLVSGAELKDPAGDVVGGDVVEGKGLGAGGSGLGTGEGDAGTGGQGDKTQDQNPKTDPPADPGATPATPPEDAAAAAGTGGADGQGDAGTGGRGDVAASPLDTRYSVLSVLLGDAAERLAAAEIRGLETRAGKAASDRRRWNEWAGVFYDQHEVYAGKVLAPIAEAWETMGGPRVDPRLAALAVVRPIMPVFDDQIDVVQLLAGWHSTRAGEIRGILEEAFVGKRA